MCREGLLQLCESWVLHGRTVVVALSLANFIFASSMSSILFALHWALTLRLEMPPVVGLPPVVVPIIVNSKKHAPKQKAW